jgi:hypothetical protein
MQHLLQEIDTYKSMFSMRVELIPRSRKGEPEAAIFIGSRKPVSGYSNIVPEIKKAIARISAVSNNTDPVNDFFQSAIMVKDPAEEGMHAGRKDSDLASAFTRATAEREKRRPQKGISRNKNGEPPSEPKQQSQSRHRDPPSDQNEDSGGIHPGDILSARKIMASASGDVNDNSDLASMASDPIDAKWWSNQFVTAGI